MLRRFAFKATLACFFLTLLSNAALAQSKDRERLAGEIESLREQIKIKEQEFLAPSAEDSAAFAEFLSQPETGLIRLLPGEKYQQKLLIRGDGAFYSFARRTHEYGFGSDIMLEQKMFRAGFAGASFGFLVLLGDVPLEEVTTETNGLMFLTALSAPQREPQARVQQQLANEGIKLGELTYQNRVSMQVGKTYVVRSVSYNDADTLVAFRVVREDTDGSVILLWKMLKKFAAPRLTD